VAGLGLAWGVDRWTLVTRPPEYADVRRAANGGGDGATTPAVGTLLDGGRMEEAARRYFAIPAAHAQRVLEPADGLRLARWLRDNGHGAAALTILRRLLRDFPRDSERAAIHLAAGVVLLRDLEEPTAAYQHFLDALDLDPDPEIARLARQGIVAVDALQKRPWGRPRPTRRD
jgi:tetratricopeptide (TPR) repeat protein